MTSIFTKKHRAYHASKNFKIVELRKNNWLNLSTNDNPLFTLRRDVWARSTIIISHDPEAYIHDQDEEALFKEKILQYFKEPYGSFLIQFYHQNIAGLEKEIMRFSLGIHTVIDNKKTVNKVPEIGASHVVEITQDSKSKQVFATVKLTEIKTVISSFHKPEGIVLGIPGEKIVTYALTENGFCRESAEYTNPILEDLDLGNENVVITDKEQKFAEEYEKLFKYVSKKESSLFLKNQVKQLLTAVNAARKRYPENIEKFTECLTKTTELVADPNQIFINEYAQFVKQFETNRSWGMTVSGAMLGVLGAVLIAVSITALFASFGTLMPLTMVGLGFGAASLAGCPFMMFNGLKKDTPLSKIMTQICQTPSKNNSMSAR